MEEIPANISDLIDFKEEANPPNSQLTETPKHVKFLESLGWVTKPVPILHRDVSLSPQLFVPVYANLLLDLDK